MKTLKISILCVFLMLNLSLSAQEENAKEVKQRPKIGLVLSGGGAKGLAHVGVLKVLEELGIKPDYITGSSMGAIVGGLYSIGYSAADLDSLVRAIDWNTVFSDEISYDQIGFNVKSLYSNYLLNVTGNSFKEIRLPMGVVDGQLISELLAELTWRSLDIDSFDDFPIPFRCVATDIISGKAIVFKSGDLGQAIRASMAIPTAFTPIVLDDMLLVDGGVINNFPVQECLNMGADIVIGVYVGSNENASVKDFNSMVKILSRSASFLGVVNAKEQMNHLDIKILPNLNDAKVESFNMAKEIVQMGETSARQDSVYTKLSALAASLKSYPKKELKTWNATEEEIIIQHIHVKGLVHVEKAFVIGRSQITANDTVNSKLLKASVKRLYASLIFDKIDYSFIKTDEGHDLVFNVIEKDQISIKSSVYYDNYFGAGLVLNASYKHLLVNSSRLDLAFDISKYPRAKVQYNLIGGQKKEAFFCFRSIDTEHCYSKFL